MKCGVDEIGKKSFFKMYAYAAAHVKMNKIDGKNDDKPKAISAENDKDGKQALENIFKSS
jgi:uncharacterized membrane protein